MITCGEQITYLREQKGLTQEELASKLGISRSALSHYEKNRREPEFQVLSDIADLFGVSLDFLFGRTPKHGEYEETRDL
ncbi:HTH-type transcriptional regulator Xre [compost metagenome]